MKSVILLNLDVLIHSFYSGRKQRCFRKKSKKPQRNCLKVLQLPVDWASVNSEVLEMLDDHLNEKKLPKIRSIGRCNQHILYGALQTAVQSSVWNLDKVMNAIYWLLHERLLNVKCMFVKVVTVPFYWGEFCKVIKVRYLLGLVIIGLRHEEWDIFSIIIIVKHFLRINCCKAQQLLRKKCVTLK